MMMRITKVIGGDDGGLVVVEPHQGQACVAKVCAQPVHETEYCSTYAAALNTINSNNTGQYYASA